jgi:NADH-quinone oxidoreductase subunit M
MIPVLLIAIPLVSGLLAFLMKGGNRAANLSIIGSIATLAVTLWACTTSSAECLSYSTEWIPLINSTFTVSIDTLAMIMVLLTGLTYPLILFIASKNTYSKPHNYFGLMSFMQAGLMGVFVANDALLFYFFWELVLIPAYFLCSQWGGEKRIAATIKFFLYTFFGSLFMLIGIIFISSQAPDHSFSWEAFTQVRLAYKTEAWVFWFIFIAFAIKVPIFPVHTWQPDTYEQSPTSTTMVLSGLMVKMGIFAILKWVVPVMPMSTWAWGDTIATLSVIGMLYASVIALRQNDIKRLVAYSSIAHMGLMVLGIFVASDISLQGVMIQMFNHGITIIALWMVVDIIERNTGTRKLNELGGLAQKQPALAILFVVIAFANIALPLTNGFIGEFLLFTGIFTSEVSSYNVVFTVLAGLGIILSAIYTLNMLQKVLFGKTNSITEKLSDITLAEKCTLAALVVVIIVLGVYPQPFLEYSQKAVDQLLSVMLLKRPS